MFPFRFPSAMGALALMLLISACDFATIQSDLEDAVVPRMTIPAAPAEFAVVAIDAATDRPVEGLVTYSISGEDQDQIVDPIFFDRISEASSEAGAIVLAVPDGVTPSAADPVRFAVTASAAGYAPATQPIAVRALGADVFEVRLQRQSDAAPDAGLVGARTAAVCEAGVEVTVANRGDLPVRAVVTAPGRDPSTHHLMGDTFTVRNFPSDLAEADIALYFEDDLVGMLTLDAPCGKQETIELENVPASRTTADLTANVVCSEENVTALPSVLLQARRAGVAQENWMRVVEGQLRVDGVMLGAEYEATLVYHAGDGVYEAFTHRFVAEGEPNADGVVEIEEDFVDIADLCDRL